MGGFFAACICQGEHARTYHCDHPYAIRILSRAWSDRKPYHPASHGALQDMLKAAKGRHRVPHARSSANSRSTARTGLASAVVSFSGSAISS
jgi:hypothetical protein